MRRALLIIGLALLGCERDAPPTLDAPPPAPGPALGLAGDDAATPLVRHLVQVFESRMPGARLVMHAPLGGDGARLALADGLLAGALVVVPTGSTADGIALARTTVVPVVGPGVRDRRLTVSELQSALAGRAGAWPGGLPRRLALRPASDPLQRAYIASESPLAGALGDALTARRWPVYSRESALRDALREPGVIGLADRGNLRLHGSPTFEVPLGLAPVSVEIRVLTVDPVPARLQAFLRFATGEEGQSLIADLGFERVR